MRRFRALFGRAPHASSRAIGFAVCGLVASVVQHVAGTRGPDSYAGLLPWGLLLAVAAGSLGLGARVALPSKVPAVLCDALGSWVVVVYALADAAHTRLFARHIDRATVIHGVDAIRTRAIRFGFADVVAVMIGAALLGLLLAVGFALLARLPRLSPAWERRSRRIGIALACVVGATFLFRDLVFSATPAWTRALYWHAAIGEPLERPEAKAGDAARFGSTFTEAQFEHVRQVTTELKSGTFEAKVDRPLDVVLIHVESLRWDMLAQPTMPRLWAWRDRCAVSPRHYSTSINTGGGMFGALTGMAPYYYPALRRHRTLAPTLRVLARLGYTRQVWYPNEALALDGIFDVLVGDLATPRVFEGDPTHVADAAMVSAYLDEVTSPGAPRPRFDYVIIDSSHYDYSYPDEFEVNRPAETLGVFVNRRTGEGGEGVPEKDPGRRGAVFNRYKNSVLWADELVGRLLDGLEKSGRLGETVVAIFGDHGEAFWDKGGPFGHNTALTDAQARVPLVLCSSPRIEIAYGVTSHADIFPTVFDLMGLRAARPFMTGKSLRRYDPSADVAILRHRIVGSDDDPRHAIVHGDLKVGFWDGPDPHVMWVRDRNDDLVTDVPPSRLTAALAGAVSAKLFR
jgi:hypothetical protein